MQKRRLWAAFFARKWDFGIGTAPLPLPASPCFYIPRKSEKIKRNVRKDINFTPKCPIIEV
jgi:hypothetical protein